MGGKGGWDVLIDFEGRWGFEAEKRKLDPLL